MGLFSKKICVICGEKAGLLSRLKLENDDFVCGNCQKKLSPFFDHKDKVHTEKEIRDHIAWRESTREEVAIFQADDSVQLDGKDLLLINHDEGKFVLIESGTKKEDADVFSLDEIVDAMLTVEENKKEIKKEIDGEKKPYNPPHYSYKYHFLLSVRLNNPYIKEIEFRLHQLAIDGGDDADGYQAPSILEKATGFYVWREKQLDGNDFLHRSNFALSSSPGGYGPKGSTTMTDFNIEQFDKMVNVGSKVVELLTGQQKEPAFKSTKDWL